MKLSNEAKVGALVLGTTLLAFGFAWVIGIDNPFKKSTQFYVTYNFAGGVEVGSPVRVSGIKVGKVEKIDFFVPVESETPNEVAPVRLKVSVLNEAAVGVKSDSRFYVNLAGVIGDRYIEITPGSPEAPAVKNGQVLTGIDPPRLDQLISQSFDLAGKITHLIEENKGDLSKSIELLYKLSNNFNKTLKWVDRSKIFKQDFSKLITNIISITEDVRRVTDQVRTPEGEKTLTLLYKLLWRLEPLDSENIREFLQKEGVKIQLF